MIAKCSVDYAGRLTAHLPMADRVLMLKADGSVLVHSDGGSYKPLNWMSPPCTTTISEPSDEQAEHGITEIWTVTHQKTGDHLIISIAEIRDEISADLGVDPGLVKDGVESHLQELLAEHIETLGSGYSTVRREYMTAIGPVDILAKDDDGASVAVEIKRRGEIDGTIPTQPVDSNGDGTDQVNSGHIAIEIKRRAGIDAVEQLTRYVDFLNRDPLLRPVRGLLAAQSIAPQARTLANDRDIECVVVDYDALRGMDDPDARLF